MDLASRDIGRRAAFDRDLPTVDRRRARHAHAHACARDRRRPHAPRPDRDGRGDVRSSGMVDSFPAGVTPRRAEAAHAFRVRPVPSPGREARTSQYPSFPRPGSRQSRRAALQLPTPSGLIDVRCQVRSIGTGPHQAVVLTLRRPTDRARHGPSTRPYLLGGSAPTHSRIRAARVCSQDRRRRCPEPTARRARRRPHRGPAGHPAGRARREARVGHLPPSTPADRRAATRLSRRCRARSTWPASASPRPDATGPWACGPSAPRAACRRRAG